MNWVKSVILTAIVLTAHPFARAGVSVGGTRVVFEATKKEVSLSVKNPPNSPAYLIQSWLDNALPTDVRRVPFVITPPLFRLGSGEENLLRIINTNPDLPQDRESLYWLNIKSLAAARKSNENRLQIVVRTRIKLFYRPTGLSGTAADAYKALVFSRQGNTLHVSNPTPYYISFFKIAIGSVPLKMPGMIEPKGTLTLQIPAKASGPVSWQAINDYGGTSEIAH